MERGGIGHTARALTMLDAVDASGRVAGDDVLRSLASSTRGSLLRQAGRHRDAVRHDGAALRLAAANVADGAWWRAAFIDALVGLAADDLGMLRFGASDRLLSRARAVHADRPGQWWTDHRPHLRVEWVSTELAIYTGDPSRAVEHAEHGLRLADRDDVPVRHRVKTLLIAAAAAASSGDEQLARERASAAAAGARAHGLLPLYWASSSLLSALDPDDPDLSANVARSRSELIYRGVPFTEP
ncbi:hypothetical protein AAFP35_07655 [Gordonia sp. CPCC 206044]|uniref:hypothetical protein n=1 Tax=Gordonia sp. CPCC 206044 TaxID=3140793 RepID=UPI003AF3EF0D